MITLIEKVKPNKKKQREYRTSIPLAEKMLRKSKGWSIKDGEPFVFKDGKLAGKAVNNQSNKPKADKD